MKRRRSTSLSRAQLARRTQIGEQRRQRTRLRLLGAASRLFARHGNGALSVDDVIAEAGVARGSFYNYFRTCDELFEAIADDLASSINLVIRPRLDGVSDPAARISLAFRIFLHFAVADPTRGWIFLRTMPLVGPLNLEMKTFIEAEFEEALAGGRFTVPSLNLAVDLAFGFVIMTLHRLLTAGGGDTYIDRSAEVLLVSMGLTKNAARRIASIPVKFDTFPALGDVSATYDGGKPRRARRGSSRSASS